MNKETKNIVGLLLIIAVAFAGMIFGWLHSPMYADVKDQKRLEVKNYLIKNYFFMEKDLRQSLMEKYKFTENEISPDKIMPYNQNLGGLK